MFECSLCKETFRDEATAYYHGRVCDFDDYAIKSGILGKDYAEWMDALDRGDPLEAAKERASLAYKVILFKHNRAQHSTDY
jgi:hypothetical protein